MEASGVLLALLCALLTAGQAVILPFLEPPKHDGVKRLCRLTADNYTAVVTAAEIAVLIFEDPSASDGSAKGPSSSCPSDLEKFGELTAQVLRKRNILVCVASSSIAAPQTSGSTAPNAGDVYIFKKGQGKPYYGRRSTSAVIGFLFKVNNTQVNAITGKLDKIAFDAVQETKVVGFFMQGTADYLAFEEAAAALSPSVVFHAVFDRVVAKYLKLDTVGQILLIRTLSKIPVACPQNPASAADIANFVGQSKGALLTKIDKHNLYDPQLLDSSRILVLAIAEQSSPIGGYFNHLVTKLVRNNTNNTEFDKLNMVWIEPQIFPTIYLMMDELETTLGIPNKFPAFGTVNVTTLQSAWLNTASINVTADKAADEKNLLLLQDFLNGVINNTVIPVKLGSQAFVQTPTSQVLLEGSSAVLECVVENPVGDCLWLKDGRSVGYNLARLGHYSWRGDPLSGDCSLAIASVRSGRDEGEWVCEVTGDLETPTLTSQPAKIVITPATPPTPPKSEL